MDILQHIGILDLVFIVILAISVLLGLVRGVIREVLSLTGLIAAVYLAFSFANEFSTKYVYKFIEDPQVSYIVTFALIVVATLFVITLVNLTLSQLLKASGLSFINRLFGLVFGLLRGALICSILVMVLGFVPGITSKSWWKASSMVPVFSLLTKKTLKYMPDEASGYFNFAKDKVTQAANEIAVPLPTLGKTPTSTVKPKEEKATEKTAIDVNTVRPASETQVILQSINQSSQETSNQSSKENQNPAGIVLESSN